MLGQDGQYFAVQRPLVVVPGVVRHVRHLRNGVEIFGEVGREAWDLGFVWAPRALGKTFPGEFVWHKTQKAMLECMQLHGTIGFGDAQPRVLETGGVPGNGRGIA